MDSVKDSLFFFCHHAFGCSQGKEDGCCGTMAPCHSKHETVLHTLCETICETVVPSYKVATLDINFGRKVSNTAVYFDNITLRELIPT